MLKSGCSANLQFFYITTVPIASCSILFVSNPAKNLVILPWLAVFQNNSNALKLIE